MVIFKIRLKYKEQSFDAFYTFLGIGDWGLGIGDWGLGPPIPNPQSPIPNPQSQSPIPTNYLVLNRGI